MTDTWPLAHLPPRAADSHKGDYGRVLIVGGSRGMYGAPALAGMAMLRGGAGLVQVATPRECQPVVAGFEPAYMTVGLTADNDGRLAEAAIAELEALRDWPDVVAVGPGLGRSVGVDRVVAELFTTWTQPIVVDADGLNALARQPELLNRAGGPRILTPHPGEFQRLAGAVGHKLSSAMNSRAEHEAAAQQLAGQWGVVIVLKGHHTLVTDGTRSAHNTTGNPGMATGGAGDVLTGLIAALVGQHLAPIDAARLAVHLHGLAGDAAAAALGQVSLTAGDVVRYLHTAIARA
ncbi:MAG: NAD(P)H-hydrate dehydratase [Planctomycetes bacterium]|nr:NAD(P)H-hydrate dehydratase [Planctomycetota bacterium]